MNTHSTSLVTAATGRIGGRVALALLDAGRPVRVVSRDRDALGPLIRAGAEPAIGDLREPGFAERALDGIATAFLVVRADRRERDFRGDFGRVGQRVADAMRSAGTRRAVFLSALGVRAEQHRGLVLVHRDVELALGRVPGLEATFLRAPFFAENLLYFLDTMHARGGLYTPIDPDVEIDVASTGDLAEIAARLMADGAGPGPVEVRSAGLTMRGLADAIAAELGRAFPVGRTTRDADVERMVASGASYDFAHLMNDAWDTYSRGGRIGEVGAPGVTAGTSAARIAREIVALGLR